MRTCEFERDRLLFRFAPDGSTVQLRQVVIDALATLDGPCWGVRVQRGTLGYASRVLLLVSAEHTDVLRARVDAMCRRHTALAPTDFVYACSAGAGMSLAR